MNLTPDQALALLAAVALILLTYSAWESRRAEKARADADQLRRELMIEKGRVAAESMAYQRLANLVERHSDELASLRKAAGHLPPPRRAKELPPRRLKELPEYATATTELVGVMGVIELASPPRTLRERMAANDPALRWDNDHPIIALAAV